MTNPLHDKNHPIWPLLRLIIMMIALTVILKVTANHFDKTEISTIVTMFLVGGGVESLSILLRKVNDITEN